MFMGKGLNLHHSDDRHTRLEQHGLGTASPN